ncbi:biogenesis of lysosome-related organelles complex 1 subunit 3 [Diaphorina citri]|uniref:Biogenesis of lysosome-related organelles complex 1 subunit 3 n=1 Tax=Diaphorina citri TaxID=121845 RepID=A0A3Q0J6M9_DIACI|nr:biogenesis of lysosome-related organelles complex 1 subunit 3 [Diaphorina citri]
MSMSMSKHAHADIVAGEASESDEEISNEPVSTSNCCQRLPTQYNGEGSQILEQFQSAAYENSNHASGDCLCSQVLHNYLLQTAVKDFLHSTTAKAVKSLNNSNQQLMKTQIILQETASALKSCSNNMNLVHNKLSSSLANTVIPDIQIQVPPPIPRSY